MGVAGVSQHIDGTVSQGLAKDGATKARIKIALPRPLSYPLIGGKHLKRSQLLTVMRNSSPSVSLATFHVYSLV